MRKEELWEIAKEVWRIEISAIEDLVSTIDKDALFRALEMIENCKIFHL